MCGLHLVGQIHVGLVQVRPRQHTRCSNSSSRGVTARRPRRESAPTLPLVLLKGARAGTWMWRGHQTQPHGTESTHPSHLRRSLTACIRPVCMSHPHISLHTHAHVHIGGRGGHDGRAVAVAAAAGVEPSPQTDVSGGGGLGAKPQVGVLLYNRGGERGGGERGGRERGGGGLRWNAAAASVIGMPPSRHRKGLSYQPISSAHTYTHTHKCVPTHLDVSVPRDDVVQRALDRRPRDAQAVERWEFGHPVPDGIPLAALGGDGEYRAQRVPYLRPTSARERER